MVHNRAPMAPPSTAIVLTADHGEALGDHGMSWHGAEIWESLVRVPLVVYVPGIAPRRIPLKRSHIDLAPTLLELMGIEAGEGELSGQSLVPEVEGEGEAVRQGVHGEGGVLVDAGCGREGGRSSGLRRRRSSRFWPVSTAQ